MRWISLYIFLLLPLHTILLAQTISIDEERFISIEGIEQWITIKGDDKTKPIVLLIHGGPGSTMSQYSNNIYGSWVEDFVVVNWDQRGAGRTFGKNAPPVIDMDFYVDNPLTVDQMTRDGIAVAKYLVNYLSQEKVILIGTSWGSVLGVEMALHSPELFHAYIGLSQFVNFSRNFDFAYSKVYQMATDQEDEIALEKLNTLGAPPYEDAKDYGQLLRIIKKYERDNSIAAPDSWWKIAASYDNENDNNDRNEGDDYSFINFVGHAKLNIESMVSHIDFAKNGLVFKVPVYIIQGAQDILTAETINRPYFDQIQAPVKEYHLMEDAAHGHNQSVLDKQFEIVKRCIAP